jgi:4-carboxymuconolactone decarboxylase
MRLPPIAPDALSAAQRLLHEEMKAGVTSKYDAFVTMREDGALLGPWSAWLHQPEVGAAFSAVTKAMTAFKVLLDAVRQIVILVVGARFKAAYEIYAHTAVAKAKARHEISDARLATLAAGERPGDLTEQEAAGYDVATASRSRSPPLSAADPVHKLVHIARESPTNLQVRDGQRGLLVPPRPPAGLPNVIGRGGGRLRGRCSG